MPYGKFVFMRGEGQHPIAERHGYMWPCVWLSMFRSIGWAGWVTFVNRFGMPVPLIEYDGSIAQYTEYKQAYQDIMSNLGTGQGAIYPSSGARFRIEQPANGGRSSDPHSALSDACDSAQSVRVLGATLTTKIGNVGSFSASETHIEVKYAREEADARRMWSALRSQLLAPLVRINAAAIAEALRKAGYGRVPSEALMRRIPRGLHRVPKQMDPAARMGVIKEAVSVGMRVSHEGVAYELDLPEPKGPHDIIPGEPQQVTSGGKVIGGVEAATKGAEAPKEPEPPKKQQPSPSE
jgi:phage gp29-like protein